jgi:hypothetical protein
MRYLLFLFVIISSITLAQNGINYQGAATDSDGAKLVDQNISLRTSVLQGDVDGTTSYSETHNTTTDQFGLFNVVIGQGEVVSGVFDSISWGADAHFLKVELDATGGSDYSLVSTTQMMSVPYAKYAESTNINYDSISNLISNNTGNSSQNMITPNDINLICKSYLLLDNLNSSDPIKDISIDNESNIYAIKNVGNSYYNTQTYLVKYDSLFNIQWEINPNVTFLSGVKYNQSNNKLYVVGKLGGYWPSGSSYNYNIGTSGSGSINDCQIESGYGFVAEINPSDGSCNWASSVGGSQSWPFQDPMFTFNNDYFCFLTKDHQNNCLNLNTFDITNGELVYSESCFGGSGQSKCILSENNELIVKNGSQGYSYNIFDGSYNSSITYNSGHEDNSLLFSSSGELLTFYNSGGDTYYINSQSIGENNNTPINTSISLGSGQQFAYKTNNGYSLLIGYENRHVLVWDQLYLEAFHTNTGKFMILDLDDNFNITNSYNISTLTSFNYPKYAVSSNNNKCLFVRMQEGKISINGDEHIGENDFLIFFE